MAEIKRRAVSSAQKEKRRQDILRSARELFEASSDYSSLLMKHIADNLGLTKGTLYLYFKTKEEVFLAIYTEEFNRCFDQLEAVLDELPISSEPGQVADIMSQQLCENKTFLKLTAMLHSVLEQNIDFDTALAFKTLIRDRLVVVGNKIEQCLPSLESGKGMQILFSSHALLIGFFHTSLHNPSLDAIYDMPGMDVMKIDFESSFKQALRLMLFAIVEKSDL